jgi:hypothetical protein
MRTIEMKQKSGKLTKALQLRMLRSLPKGSEILSARYTQEERENYATEGYNYHNVEVIYNYLNQTWRAIMRSHGGWQRT